MVASIDRRSEVARPAGAEQHGAARELRRRRQAPGSMLRPPAGSSTTSPGRSATARAAAPRDLAVGEAVERRIQIGAGVGDISMRPMWNSVPGA